MRFNHKPFVLISIFFVLAGAFLMALKIDDLSIIGHLIKLFSGFGCFFIAGVFLAEKNKHRKSP